MNKNKEKRGGFYWKNSTPYLAVTEPLKILDKPAIRVWLMKSVWQAMVADPTLSEQEAMAAPYKKSKEAASRGATIHSLVETYKVSGKRITTAPALFQPFLKAFYDWLDDNDIEILESEKTIFSEIHKIAGTCDLIVKNRQSNKVFLVDVKTSKDGKIYDEAALQISAYFEILKENGVKIDQASALGLAETGKYTFVEQPYVFDQWLACKSIWLFKNRDLVKAVKYQERSKNVD